MSVSVKSGDQYGEWTLIESLPGDRNWLATCSCGRQKKIFLGNLRNGALKSCGSCGSHRTHGNTETRTYKSWRSMRDRCENPSNPRYHRYGGRGIKVCVEWLMFEIFLKDMGPRPEGMTLDRKDSDGDYTPENCRWATAKQQMNNRPGQARYLINGIEGTVTEICGVLGLRAATVAYRLRSGWKVKDAFRPGNFNKQKNLGVSKNSSRWKVS